MSSIKYTLSKQPIEQLIAQGKLVHGKLVPAAPATPPVPNMAGKAAALLTATNEAETANDDYEAAKAALAGLKAVRDAKKDALRAAHAAVIAGVEAESGGDPVMLSAPGYPLAAEPVQSTQPPLKVSNLALTAGDAEGQVDGQFDPQERVGTYEVQCTTGDPVTGPWTTVVQPTASKFTLTSMTSGQRCWVRVRAHNVNGPGAWSDPATKIVP